MTAVEEDSRAEARLGMVLRGKYRLDRVLGTGGMAVVYAATHRNKKRFAVKILHAEVSINREIRARFLREGYVANAVEHPGAVAVLDDDTAEDGAAFLVMELLEGKVLEQLWEEQHGRLSVQVVLAATFQLLDVLAAAHSKAIVHRDIKPANLFVARDGTLKVLDFGIARLREATASGHSATSTGMLLGTPAYMAPEQALAKASEIDGRTDLWAVGASMFTLLSGQLVHEGDNASQIVVAAATRQARSLASVAPTMDRHVVEVVDQALAFDRANRWPTAAAMRDAVGNAYATLFGARVDRAPLEAFFGQPIGLEATGAATGRPPTKSAPVVDAVPIAPMLTHGLSAPQAHRQADQVFPVAQPVQQGTTTAQAVSTDEVGVPGVGAAKRRVLFIATLGLMIGLAAVTIALVRGGSGAAPGSVSSAASTLTAAIPSIRSAEAAPPPMATGSLPGAAIPVESLPTASAPRSVLVAPRGTPAFPPAATPPTPSTRASGVQAARAPDCDPNYTLDANGEQHFKPECFAH